MKEMSKIVWFIVETTFVIKMTTSKESENKHLWQSTKF